MYVDHWFQSRFKKCLVKRLPPSSSTRVPSCVRTCVRRTCFTNTVIIVSDFNNVFLWHESENIYNKVISKIVIDSNFTFTSQGRIQKVADRGPSESLILVPSYPPTGVNLAPLKFPSLELLRSAPACAWMVPYSSCLFIFFFLFSLSFLLISA